MKVWKHDDAIEAGCSPGDPWGGVAPSLQFVHTAAAKPESLYPLSPRPRDTELNAEYVITHSPFGPRTTSGS